jgi:hypothetical protein
MGMIEFRLTGGVVEAETGIGLPGLFVKAYDKDLLFDDLLGTAITGPRGEFEIVSVAEDFREFFEQRPDLYLRIFAAGGKRQIYTTEAAVRWDAGRYEHFDVRIPRDQLEGHAPKREINLIGEDGVPQSVFQPGESLALHLRGSSPSTPHQVKVLDEDGRELFTDIVMSNRDGEIEPTVIWPLLGLEDPEGQAVIAIEEALERWHGRRLHLSIAAGDRIVGESDITLDSDLARPVVVSTDDQGAVRSGFEIGERDAAVAIHNPPDWESARVYLVSRQHDWRIGDTIRPVELVGGRTAWRDVDIRGSKSVRVVVAEAGELPPGAYDFVVRRLRYGWEDDDDLLLRAEDLIGGRWTTGLVVRERFMPSKVIRGGCVNLQRQMVGRMIGIWPYIQYTDVFQVGEDIYGALDPAALDAGLISKMVAIYVVPHKTPAQWSADASLSHLAVLGGNPAVLRWLTQSWCINANFRLLWPNATQVGEYDVVADFGNNTGNPAAFVPDGTFSMPVDLIDGYTDPGFRVVPDPTTDTAFANAGSFSYSESTEGYVDVVDDYGSSWHVPLKAVVYFPADVAGATLASQISVARPDYPLVVVVHGNGPLGGYLGYNYLLEHLARNGFVAASIHLEPNQSGTDRARVLRRHLQVLFARFGSNLANNIGTMGHSRGGEAVVIAARLNQQEGWGYSFNAVISLAPTNQYTSEQFAPPWAAPYLVIYGSLDGDLAGIPNTGFELYDRASGLRKSMAFVYRSCHDRYNTVWGDGDITAWWSKLGPTDVPRVLSVDAHHKIAMGYMTAFFRQHLRAESQWAGIFRGEWMPAAVRASDGDMRIYVQFEDVSVETVDNFEGPHTATSWQTSTIGGAVSQVGLPATPQENNLRSLDPQSPHATAGLMLRWDNLNDSLRFDVPVGSRDLRAFQALSFRVTQKVNSASNPANQAQDLRVTMTDANGQSRAIRVSKFADIPYPDVRGIASYTKSAMRTIRIPLSAFTIRCLNIPEINTGDVVSVAFEFAEKATGEIEIDSVQATA